MAMTVKKGDVVKLNERYWSYQGKHTAGHIGVVTAIHGSLDPRGGHQWVNVDDEEGAPFWIPVTTMSMVESNPMLLEDIADAGDSRNGDVLVAHRDNDDEANSLEAGDLYTLSLDDCGCCGHAVSEDGDNYYPSTDDYWFINLSALKRKYQSDAVEPSAEVIPYPTAIFLDEAVEPAPDHPKYEDMDNAAKGAILLAAHEGKMIQFMSNMGNVWVDDTSFDPSENFAYRVKPQALIDAEEALNAATSNVISLADVRDEANEAADRANAALAAAELEEASANDTVEVLRAA
ncbi:putative coil containing protein [Vibrio phage 464E53-1]|nr:putative coil containing protein [Vibrio phage 464E53-1]